MQKSIKSPSLGLYIHIPWCVKKCPYCDFNSHELQSNTATALSLESHQEGEYLRQLICDWQQELSDWRKLCGIDAQPGSSQQKPVLSSVFIGGGTPSLASPEFYAELFETIFQDAAADAAIEITLEANPGTAEAGKFCGFREAGINRLSIGVQSFADQYLSRLGRIHSGSDAKAAFDMARYAGFENINLDLMHGLPGQDVEGALHDLELAIDLSPEHISWYQLTIEKNTHFYSEPPLLPLEDTLEEINMRGFARLAAAEYQRYEVSAFARAGLQSVHNTNYWLFGDYFGIGAGAHGKLSCGRKIVRRQKTRWPKDYLNPDSGFTNQKDISFQERPLEFVMNALRLEKGFSKRGFEERTALPFATIEQTVDSLVEKALLINEDDRIAATALGFRYLDSVIGEF